MEIGCSAFIILVELNQLKALIISVELDVDESIPLKNKNENRTEISLRRSKQKVLRYFWDEWNTLVPQKHEWSSSGHWVLSKGGRMDRKKHEWISTYEVFDQCKWTLCISRSKWLHTRCPCHFTVCVSAVFLMAYRLSALINYKNHKWAQNNRQCDNERTSYVGNTREKRDTHTHTKKHHSHNEWIEEEKKIDRMLNKNYIEKIQNRKRKIRSRKATTRHTHTDWVSEEWERLCHSFDW